QPAHVYKRPDRSIAGVGGRLLTSYPLPCLCMLPDRYTGPVCEVPIM
ncbi:unnamed protein product, partial [Staurois parvus]